MITCMHLQKNLIFAFKYNCYTCIILIVWVIEEPIKFKTNCTDLFRREKKFTSSVAK